MTKEETKERIKVMQAYVDGKQIQYFDGRVWCDSADPAWNPCKKYRIKPETKYRPFSNTEECWKEMQKHQPFGWLKTDDGYEPIQHVNEVDDFNATFKYCTFADGTPFGVKVEE